MNILIKSFGNNTQCATREELKTALTEKYQGMSITIEKILPSGIRRNTFVDVSSAGVMSDSYTHAPISIWHFG